MRIKEAFAKLEPKQELFMTKAPLTRGTVPA